MKFSCKLWCSLSELISQRRFNITETFEEPTEALQWCTFLVNAFVKLNQKDGSDYFTKKGKDISVLHILLPVTQFKQYSNIKLEGAMLHHKVFSSVELARNKTHFLSDVRNLNAHSSLMHIHAHVFSRRITRFKNLYICSKCRFKSHPLNEFKLGL